MTKDNQHTPTPKSLWASSKNWTINSILPSCNIYPNFRQKCKSCSDWFFHMFPDPTLPCSYWPKCNRQEEIWNRLILKLSQSENVKSFFISLPQRRGKPREELNVWCFFFFLWFYAEGLSFEQFKCCETYKGWLSQIQEWESKSQICLCG